MNLGDKIYELRSAKGISQEDMAYDLNVSRQAVSKWETNQSLPDLDKIKALSEYFGVSIDDLVKEDKNVKLEENKSSYNVDKVKRRILLLLKTAFVLLGLNFITFLYVMLDNGVIIYSLLVDQIISNLFFMTTIFLLIKRIYASQKKVGFEIVMLLVGILGVDGIISSVCVTIQNKEISSLNIERISEFLVILNRIDLFRGYWMTMYHIGIVATIITRLFYPCKYQLVNAYQEYKVTDLVLSLLVGLFLGIPGLIFEVLWLVDAYRDNKIRFKKMLIGYIIGVAVAILIYLIWFLLAILF